MKILNVIETKENAVTQIKSFAVQDEQLYDKVKSEATNYMVSLMEKAGADFDCTFIAMAFGGSSFNGFTWEIVETEIFKNLSVFLSL
jgi:hypothetical protein